MTSVFVAIFGIKLIFELMGLRTNGPSDEWAFGLTGLRTKGGHRFCPYWDLQRKFIEKTIPQTCKNLIKLYNYMRIKVDALIGYIIGRNTKHHVSDDALKEKRHNTSFLIVHFFIELFTFTCVPEH